MASLLHGLIAPSDTFPYLEDQGIDITIQQNDEYPLVLETRIRLENQGKDVRRKPSNGRASIL